MTATKTVTFDQAVEAVISELVVGKKYQYGEIADVLKKHFPEINSNQISGLITRFSKGNTAIFESEKEIGSRKKYILQQKTAIGQIKELNEISIKQKIINNIQQSIVAIQQIPSKDIKDSNDFKLIKESESALNEVINALENKEYKK